MNPFDRITYFENLSKSHVLVAHEVDERKSFLKNYADEIAASELLKLNFPCVVANVPIGRVILKDDQPRKKYLNQLRFISKFSITSENNFSIPKSKEAASELTYEVMQDYLNKIQSDYETNGPCGDFGFIDENSYRWEPIELIGDNMCGWDLFFFDEENANFQIDDNKWQ